MVHGAARVAAARVGARAARSDLVRHWVGNLEAAAVALDVWDHNGDVIFGIRRFTTIGRFGRGV